MTDKETKQGEDIENKEAAEAQEEPRVPGSRAELIASIVDTRRDDFNEEQRRMESKDLLETGVPELAVPARGAKQEGVDEEGGAEESIKAVASEGDGEGDADATLGADGENDEKESAKSKKSGADVGDIYEFLGETDLKKRVRAVVDGKEEEVGIDQLIANYQKGKAADKRLAEAAAAKREAERILASLEHTRKDAADDSDEGATSKQYKQPLPAAGETAPSVKDALSRFAAAIYEGDEEAAAAILEPLLEEKRRADDKDADATSVDLAAISRQVRLDMEWDQALSAFASKNQDIAADETLVGIWQANLNAAAAQSTTPADAVAEATRLTREWLGKITPSNPKPREADVPNLEERRQRKEQAKRLDLGRPSNIAAPSDKSNNDTKPQSGSDIVANMRKQRGQAA